MSVSKAATGKITLSEWKKDFSLNHPEVAWREEINDHNPDNMTTAVSVYFSVRNEKDDVLVILDNHQRIIRYWHAKRML